MDEEQIKNQFLTGEKILKDIAQRTFADKFKAYIIGVPDEIPQGALPCAVFWGPRTDFPDDSATGTQDKTETVTIQLFANAKNDFGNTTGEDTVMAMLKEMVEGIDPETNMFRTTSFMHMLRKHLTLNDSVIGNLNVSVEYDFEQNPQEPTIYQALISVTMLRRVILGPID